MIALNTAEISNTSGFISSISKCESNYINDPDNGLSCCFEDNLNEGIFKSISGSTTFFKKTCYKLNLSKYVYLCCSKFLDLFPD